MKTLQNSLYRKTTQTHSAELVVYHAGKHKIHLKENVQPVLHPPRHISVALRQKVKDNLNTMEQEGVTVRHTEPT